MHEFCTRELGWIRLAAFYCWSLQVFKKSGPWFLILYEGFVLGAFDLHGHHLYIFFIR